jgi:small multidrug resistance pump
MFWSAHMSNWFYLAAAILVEVIATSALKASNGFSRPVPAAIVIVGYSASFYLLSLTLRTVPMAVAYAIWSGVGLALITLSGMWIFKQSIDLPAIAGMGLILSGVVVIQVFSQAAPH